MPATAGEDRDPLDVLVPIEEPTFTGCVLDCRLMGVIEAEQRKGSEKPLRNDRLIGVAQASLRYSDIADIAQVRRTMLKDLEAFFVTYDRLRGVEFKVIRRDGPKRAGEILMAGKTKEGPGVTVGRFRLAAP